MKSPFLLLIAVLLSSITGAEAQGPRIEPPPGTLPAPGSLPPTTLGTPGDPGNLPPSRPTAPSVPELIVMDATDAHARVGQINTVRQAILSSGGGEMKVV